jgi:transcriptional regulator with XRE-family HTH domain
MSQLNLGITIRALRLSQKRTIQEIADSCGLSKSMVSKIETDKVFPSIATLTKIARSLGTTVSSLLKEDTVGVEVVVNIENASIEAIKTDRGYYIYPYALGYKDKKMQPYLFVAKKGEIKEHHLSHEGEEFLFVLEGEMKFQVGEIEYFLKKGDSMYFNALKVHQAIPVSDSVIYLDVFV